MVISIFNFIILELFLIPYHSQQFEFYSCYYYLSCILEFAVILIGDPAFSLPSF